MKMKSVLFFLMAVALFCCGDDSPSAVSEPDAFHWQSLMGKGISLGNALDAPTEGDWDVVIQEDYFDLIADAGFDSVRIPIRWSAHAEAKPPYTIDETFFARVDWVVEQALARGLVTVINMQYYEELLESPAEHKERFLALWKQISERYQNRSLKLYFEILNEPCKGLTNELWNEYLGDAVTVIRQTNPSRALIAGPAYWNHPAWLQHLELPEGDQNIIVTFHYYAPFEFTHQGAEWVGEQSQKWVGRKWKGTPREKREVLHELVTAVQWAKAKNVPLYLGEFGVYRKADMESRVRWTAFVRSEAEKRNIAWAYWEFCAAFGVYDPEKKTWSKELLQALIPDSTVE